MSHVLCWFGLHKWWPWLNLELLKNTRLMPTWFVCRKICLRCGEEATDYDAARMWERGWRP